MSLFNGIKEKVVKIEDKIKQSISSPYDMQEYTDINDMVGYVGFITPTGSFYRVREFGNTDRLINHGDWAMEFLALHPPKEVLDYSCEYVCSKEFNFTMVFESGDCSKLYFQCGENGLTKEQVEVINNLNKYVIINDFSEPEPTKDR